MLKLSKLTFLLFKVSKITWFSEYRRTLTILELIEIIVLMLLTKLYFLSFSKNANDRRIQWAITSNWRPSEHGQSVEGKYKLKTKRKPQFFHNQQSFHSSGCWNILPFPSDFRQWRETVCFSLWAFTPHQLTAQSWISRKRPYTSAESQLNDFHTTFDYNKLFLS